MTIKLIDFFAKKFWENLKGTNQIYLLFYLISTIFTSFSNHFFDHLIFKQTCNSSIWALSEEAHSRILYKIGSISLEVIR